MKKVILKSKKILQVIFFKIFSTKRDLTQEEWYRLEYRNEYVTRDAEKMNYFGIR